MAKTGSRGGSGGVEKGRGTVNGGGTERKKNREKRRIRRVPAACVLCVTK